jgi:hypothetical protein
VVSCFIAAHLTAPAARKALPAAARVLHDIE